MPYGLTGFGFADLVNYYYYYYYYIIIVILLLVLLRLEVDGACRIM
jgi:uncharacterized membrane protein YkvI